MRGFLTFTMSAEDFKAVGAAVQHATAAANAAKTRTLRMGDKDPG